MNPDSVEYAAQQLKRLRERNTLSTEATDAAFVDALLRDDKAYRIRSLMGQQLKRIEAMQTISNANFESQLKSLEGLILEFQHEALNADLELYDHLKELDSLHE